MGGRSLTVAMVREASVGAILVRLSAWTSGRDALDAMSMTLCCRDTEGIEVEVHSADQLGPQIPTFLAGLLLLSA